MPDIFLSYSREDQPTARHFAQGLEREGFSVWWDQSLNAGEAFDRVTEQALADARAVVVLWSKRSVDSRWVRAEATEAQANGRLVPVMIEPCKRPIIFELTHTADLAGWAGDVADVRWRTFMEGLRKFTGNSAASPAIRGAPNTTAHESRHKKLPGWAAVGALLLIAAGLGWFLHGRSVTPAPTTQAQPSVAVLPFVNMSADPEQEYFSEGLSEELINQLAHIEGLQVTARTSAFAFKGHAEDLRAVGRSLGVAHVLEGSVRKSGDRVRITAQLINTTTGYHVWSETYDRALTDVLAIQDEIAAAVTSKLGAALGLAPRTTDYGGTQSLEAYDHLLRGDAQFGKGSEEGMSAAAAEYRQALTIDPTFARASAELAIALSASGVAFTNPAALAERDEATRRALANAPAAPLSQVANMWVHSDRREWVQADAACAAAFAAARDPRAEWICGGFLSVTGRVRTALPYREAARRADPLSINVASTLVRQYAYLDMGPEIRREFARIDGLSGSRYQAEEAMLVYLMHARAPPAEIAALVARICPTTTGPCPVWAAALRPAPEGTTTLRALLQPPRGTVSPFTSQIAYAAAYLGDQRLALDALELFSHNPSAASYQALWYPLFSEARKDPRFKRMVREIGFVELWRKTGRWPDYCRPVAAEDFECF